MTENVGKKHRQEIAIVNNRSIANGDTGTANYHCRQLRQTMDVIVIILMSLFNGYTIIEVAIQT